MPYVYILKCADDSYYVGQTVNMELRLAQHQEGVFGGYTAARRPVKLMWHNSVQTVDEAFKLEQKIKKWSRAKKEALIAGAFDELHNIVEGEWKRENAQRHALKTQSRETNTGK